MRTATLITLAALALAGCAREHNPEGERLDCRPDPELLGNEVAFTITVTRKHGDLVWTDSNGIEQRITAGESWQWRCAPHREI
jgi:hypothetical protein